MLFDASEGARERFAQGFGACVVGTGPAGIALARRLAAQGFGIALMEAGDFEFTERSQEYHVGRNLGHGNHPTDISRLRYSGRTSGHRSGRGRAAGPRFGPGGGEAARAT